MPHFPTLRRVGACLVATTAIVCGLPSGAAAIGLTSVTVAPTDLQAGARSDVQIDLQLADAGDKLRDLNLALPPGLLGNPLSAPRCDATALEADACPAASAVGSTTVVADAAIIGQIPITAPGTVYDVTPQPGEPARLGIVVRPVGGILGKIVLQAPIRVRDDGDYGLTASIRGIPQTLTGIGITIRSLSLTLDGRLPSGSSFMTNPTSCEPATTQVAVTGHTGAPGGGSATFTPTGCDRVPFAPTLETSAQDARADTPTPVTVALGQPEDVGGLQPSHVRRAQVTLPEGIGFNPALAPGLGVCDDAAFGPAGEPAGCPAASDIGDVTLETPLLGALPGDVYFGRTAQEPYRLLVVASAFGVTVKLKGVVVPDPATGQLTATFDGLPPVPFTRFALQFRGGPDGVLTTPAACGPARGAATLRPFSGGAEGRATSEQAIGGCPTALSPTVAAATSTAKAKADTTLGLDIGRGERDAVPSRLDVALPAGMLGRIQQVPACPDAGVRTGECPASSRIGAVTATIGSGPQTIDVSGDAFLAGRTSDALARIVLAIPVRVGPIDLGTFVLPTQLNLGERDGRVHVVADLPPAFNGIPLRLRRLQLAITREGFLFNPTGCDPRGVDVAAAGAGGVTGLGRAPFAATGCDALAFKPTVAVSVPDERVRKPKARTPLRVELTGLASGAALREAIVTIPGALRAEVAVISGTCSAAAVEARDCPESTRIGTASATTPLLEEPLTGPVYIAQTGAVPAQATPLTLPYAVAFLREGPVRLRLDGELRLDPDGGRLIGRFAGIPDVPLDRFRLDFDRRTFRALEDLCSTTRGPAEAQLLAQSGATQRTQPKLRVPACDGRPRVAMRAAGLRTARPTAALTVTGAKPLRAVDVRLPPGLRIRSTRGLVVKAGGKRVPRSAVRARGGRLEVSGLTARTLEVQLRRGSMATSRKLRRTAARRFRRDVAATVRLRVTVTATDAERRRAPLQVRFRARAR